MPKDCYLFSLAIVMRPQLLLLLLGFDNHTLWSSPNPTALPTLHLFSAVTPSYLVSLTLNVREIYSLPTFGHSSAEALPQQCSCVVLLT